MQLYTKRDSWTHLFFKLSSSQDEYTDGGYFQNPISLHDENEKENVNENLTWLWENTVFTSHENEKRVP